MDRDVWNDLDTPRLLQIRVYCAYLYGAMPAIVGAIWHSLYLLVTGMSWVTLYAIWILWQIRPTIEED